MSRHSLALVSLCMCGSACGATTDSGIPSRFLDQALTPAMQVAARTAGSIPDGSLPAADPKEIPEVAARQIATAAARLFGPVRRGELEAQHRGPIAFDKASACGRAFLARSYFQDPLPTNYPRRVNDSSWWLVGVCDNSDRPSIVVAVSAVTQYSVDPTSGQLSATAIGEAGAIRLEGVRPDWAGTLPIEPEQAVVGAWRAVGTRVARPPQLIMRGPFSGFGYPLGASWRIQLETPVQLGSGERTDVVFVAPGAPATELDSGALTVYRGSDAAGRTLRFPGLNGDKGFDLRVMDSTFATLLPVER